MQCYIVGTEHWRQRKDPKLRARLQLIIEKTHVVLIAEEIDVNKANHLQQSQGRELAGQQNPIIPWIPINMTFGQEKAAGIFKALEDASKLQRHRNVYAKHANAIRENHWLDQIEAKCNEDAIKAGTVLITCGRNHLDFLAAKAEQRGFAVVKDEYPEGLGGKLGKLEILDL
jgi:hypothetical protein